MATKKKKKKAKKAKKARAAKGRKAKKAAARSSAARSTEKKRPPRRRAPRIKAIKGPFQIGLPLQMPLALGVEAFQERAPILEPAPPDPVPDEVGPSIPEGEQGSLFDPNDG